MRIDITKGKKSVFADDLQLGENDPKKVADIFGKNLVPSLYKNESVVKFPICFCMLSKNYPR